MLFNLQSAFVLRCHRGGFSTRSLERLIRIPQGFRFVNTFFQKILRFFQVLLFVFISQVLLAFFMQFEYKSLIFRRKAALISERLPVLLFVL